MSKIWKTLTGVKELWTDKWLLQFEYIYMEAKPQMGNKICFRTPFTFIPCSGRMAWLMFWMPTAVNYLSPWLWFGTSAIDLEDSMVSFFPCRRKKTEKKCFRLWALCEQGEWIWIAVKVEIVTLYCNSKTGFARKAVEKPSLCPVSDTTVPTLTVTRILPDYHCSFK